MRLQRAMHGRNTIGISVSVALLYFSFSLQATRSGVALIFFRFSPVLSCPSTVCPALLVFSSSLHPCGVFSTLSSVLSWHKPPIRMAVFFVFGHPLFPPPTPLLSLHTCQQPFFPSISFSHSRRDPKYWDGGGFWILDLSLDRISGQPFETRLNKSSGLRVLGYLL